MVHDQRQYFPVDTEDDISLTSISPSTPTALDRFTEKLVSKLPAESHTRHSYLWPVIQIITLGLVAANLAVLIFKGASPSPSAVTSPTHKTNTTTILHSPCGNSSTTALANGCRFDIISFSWLPPACDDRKLSDEFQALREWAWYEDEDGEVPVTQEEALTGRYPHLYVSFEYHLTHCTYLWRKMHRAMAQKGRGGIDSYMGAYSHTNHCGNMLMDKRELWLGTLNGVIVVKYPDCGIFDGNGLDWIGLDSGVPHPDSPVS